VLEIGAEPFGLESSPQDILMDGGGMFAPYWELVGVERKSLLKLLDWLWIFEEEDL
jgi:hypothetical protein